MPLKTLFLLVAFFLLGHLAQSQILNIEQYRLAKDTSKSVMMKLNAGLNVFNRSAAADAPVNLFGYNVDFNTLYYPGKHAYMLVAKVDYLRINENDFLNFGFLHARANFFRENTYNFEVLTQYSYDNFRGLDPRWVFGGSLRRVLAKSEHLRLVLGIGAIYEQERWLIPGLEVPAFREVQFLKSSNYLSFRVSINDYVSLNTVNYYQVGYDREFGFFRHRLNNSTVLNTKLSERLSLTNTFEIAYEDRPIVEITNLIYSFRTGVAFNF